MSGIKELVIDLITSGGPRDDDQFWEVLNELLIMRGRLNRPVKSLRELPLALESDFKRPSERISGEGVFRTSGTTQSHRGIRPIHDYDIYVISVKEGFKRFCMYEPEPSILISLVPSSKVRPDSSLSHMASILAQSMFKETHFFREDGALIDHEGLIKTLSSLKAPTLIFGTQEDLARVLQVMRDQEVTLQLPEGSRVLFTGGSKKGGSTPQEVIDGAQELFGISDLDVLGEFGMTELFSQGYDVPRFRGDREAKRWEDRCFQTVPWLRSIVVDPETFQEVGSGKEGLLLHLDLANILWEPVILTSDIAVRTSRGFRPLRRVAGSSPRGCSQDAGM